MGKMEILPKIGWTLLIVLMVVVDFGNGVPMNIEYGDKIGLSRSNVNISSSTNSVVKNNLVQRSGCRYKAGVYASGDSVPTDESCLFCNCKGSVVVCKLRICPEVPDPPPPGCIVVQKANKCCSQLVCHDYHPKKISREQRLSTENESLPTTALETLEKGNYCVHEGTVYAEGSAMRSSTLCEHCFCIHGQMKCSSPQCIIPLNGCKPRYRSYACCPTNYDCIQSNETSILQTVPSSTPIPQYLKGCMVKGRFVAEGEPVLPLQIVAASENHENSTGINRCQTCFCMGGVVHCRPLECDRKIDNCKPIIEDGHCCPDRYDCEKGEQDVVVTTMNVVAVTTLEPDVEVTMMEEREGTEDVEKLFQKVPLFRARKDDDAEWTTLSSLSETVPTLNLITESIKSKSVPADLENLQKKARISYTSVGGFMNRSDSGAVSREDRRRKKDRVEYLSRSFYDDDAREDTSGMSLEMSGQHSTELFFDDKSDFSTSNSDGDDESTNSDMDTTLVIETNDVKTEVVTEVEAESSTKSPMIEETTTTEILDNVALRLNISPNGEISLKTQDDPPSTTKAVLTTTTTTTLRTSTTTTKPTIKTRKPIAEVFEITTTIPIQNQGYLEFIPFGVEDALAYSPMNETKYEIYPGQQASLPSYNSVAQQGSLLPPLNQPKPSASSTSNFRLKPLKLQVPLPLVADDPKNSLVTPKDSILEPVPIIVENEEKFENTIIDVPVQTSLYNNGFYGFVKNNDDAGKSSENVGIGEAIPETNISTSTQIQKIAKTTTTTTTQIPTTTSTVTRRTTTTIQNLTQKPKINNKQSSQFDPQNQNLRPINNSPKFIPSFVPVFHDSSHNATKAPSRTYSKFGIQDSSYFRYGVPNTNGFVPSGGIRLNGDQNGGGEYFAPTTSERNHMINRKVPSNIRSQQTTNSRLRYSPYHPFDDELTTYDDEDSDEQESYESFLGQNDHTSAATPFRQRFGSPAIGGSTGQISNQGQGQGHIHSPPVGFNPVHMISSSSSSVSMNKDKTTKRPGTMNTKIVNSKPLRRPKPVVDDQNLDSGDPLGFKPVVAFPFQIPKSQDNFNLGLKLSGCNIYGKMYSVGQVIHELSSICVQCRCTEVGVQCSELQF